MPCESILGVIFFEPYWFPLWISKKLLYNESMRSFECCYSICLLGTVRSKTMVRNPVLQYQGACPLSDTIIGFDSCSVSSGIQSMRNKSLTWHCYLILYAVVIQFSPSMKASCGHLFVPRVWIQVFETGLPCWELTYPTYSIRKISSSQLPLKGMYYFPGGYPMCCQTWTRSPYWDQIPRRTTPFVELATKSQTNRNSW